MKQAILLRNKSTDYGTHGALMVPEVGWSCFTAEPPWKNNRSNVSCIPPDDYIVQIRYSRKYGYTFWVTNVEGRSYVLFHSGNFSGDVEKGLKTHTKGCILLGQKKGWLSAQMSVLNSRVTVKRFMAVMGEEKFKLKVIAAA